ncbi:carbohydrate porin [Defluviimonas sp. WL0024]|uniref:Carbohydrate porin n=1 Tax=Albidovulum salinarum TaxID=2984153 RepID=A0ABT2WYJ8_9RHOB|nr:carbohydrate porin [Defluviimonas sp. WL0024]MCU9846747.1 carbohydrate porin [Defluviimonas sp. WL0024]
MAHFNQESPGLSVPYTLSMRTGGKSASLCFALFLFISSACAASAQDLVGDGFTTPNSVPGTLASTAERQGAGRLEGYSAWKQQLEDRTGLSFGFDFQAQYLGTDSDRTPSDAASGVFRLYGTWTATGRGTPNNGALVFKIENRSAIGDNISTQALGPSLGYAGLFSSTFGDAGWVLTNFYWRQSFAGGRGSFVLGQVDVFDYTNVNSLASPWTGFTNLAFEQQQTFAGPGQGLGAALQWRLNDHWAVLGGFGNANGDASDPVGSAQELFDTGETFKHFAVGWTPNWDERFDNAVQLTLWQIDERTSDGIEGGHGVSFAASTRIAAWRPFFRAGYADGGGVSMDRSVTLGTGYDARDGRDLAGVGLNWGRAPESSRDQFTIEAFYRYDATDFLQITPELQYVANPANDPDTDEILVLGLRVRAVF